MALGKGVMEVQAFVTGGRGARAWSAEREEDQGHGVRRSGGEEA